jgi:hypothetical protein
MVAVPEAEESKAVEVLGLEEAALEAYRLVREASSNLGCHYHMREAGEFADPLVLHRSLLADCLQD